MQSVRLVGAQKRPCSPDSQMCCQFSEHAKLLKSEIKVIVIYAYLDGTPGNGTHC